MIRRRGLLIAILALAIVVVLLVFGYWYVLREKPNYDEIEPGLYLGADVPSPPWRTRAVVNLCEKPDAYRADCGAYLWEEIPDAAPAPDLAWLRRVVEFIDTHRKAGETVYVHCRNGVSRSAMVVVAYLMYEHHWSHKQALDFVNSKRDVRPNPVFKPLLDEWERVVLEPPADVPK
jgi:hypothetical protein